MGAKKRKIASVAVCVFAIGFLPGCAALSLKTGLDELERGAADHSTMDADAMQTLQDAANSGSALAQYNLGLAFANGQGVMLYQERAVSWYTKSALQGFPEAQYNLGMAYI